MYFGKAKFFADFFYESKSGHFAHCVVTSKMRNCREIPTHTLTRGPGPFLVCREIRVAIPKGKLAQICIIRAAVVPLSYISNTYSCYLNHDLGGGLQEGGKANICGNDFFKKKSIVM